MRIYLDIETIPSANPPYFENVKVDSRLKDPEKIDKAQREGQEKQWRSEALVSHKGRILCIGYAIENQDPKVITGTEKEILIELDKIISDPFISWVGHNVSFDMLFIYQRALKYRLFDLANKIDGNKYKGNLEDTMEKFGGCIQWGYKIKLSDLCYFFGVPCKTEMGGSDVFDYWQEGKLDEIYEYCKEDVSATRMVYKLMVNEPSELAF